MLDSAILSGHLAAALAFMAAALPLVGRHHRIPAHRWMAAACFATALWAAGVALTAGAIRPWAAIGFIELIRTAAWMAALLQLMGIRQVGGRRRWWAAAALVAIVPVLGVAELTAPAALALPGQVARLLAAVGGLLLAENVFRASADARWAVKFLCFGTGLMFAYDFYLYADALMVRRVDADLVAARGFVDVLAAVLIGLGLVRARRWPSQLAFSSTAVLHTAALAGSGLYLLAMAAIAYGLRRADAAWGPLFQILFLSAALVLLVALFASGTLRARLRLLLHKHFLRHRYDYREVWLRFVGALSAPADATGLHDRVVRAVADVMDCPAAALWVCQPGQAAFRPAAAWNIGEALPEVPADAPLIAFLAGREWIVDLDAARLGDPDYAGVTLPGWLLAHSRAGLVVSVRHRDSLIAFLVLDRPRGRRKLDWEDFDLLRTLGRQVASTLAEAAASEALADARRLDDVGRRLAFAAHDIKNLAGQMALTLDNARRLGDDPEFRRDLVAGLATMVERLRAVIGRLKADPAQIAIAPVALDPLVETVVASWRRARPDLVCRVDAAGLWVAADGDRLASALDHLIDNALGAAGPTGKVAVCVGRRGAEALVEIADDGPGMGQAFVGDGLFRPLAGSGEGMGLGAFQARELVREMGGRLEVATAPGEGTVMRVILPQAGTAPDAGLAIGGVIGP